MSGAGRGGAGWDADESVRPENNRSSYSLDDQRSPSRRASGSKN